MYTRSQALFSRRKWMLAAPPLRRRIPLVGGEKWVVEGAGGKKMAAERISAPRWFYARAATVEKYVSSDVLPTFVRLREACMAAKWTSTLLLCLVFHI